MELIYGAAAALAAAAALIASGHAVIYKRDPRSSFAWVGVIWLAPGLGPLLYVLFGINRIERRAAKFRRRRRLRRGPLAGLPDECTREQLRAACPGFEPLAELGNRVGGARLLAGNAIEPLFNGDQAYPAMLRAIGEAQRSIVFQTYLMEDDEAGRPFIEALATAHRRGVDVRVVLDDVGIGFFRRADAAFVQAGVPTVRFLPARVPWRARTMNLRNHRKILVVDGRLGFTGSMNVRRSNLLALNPPHPERDVHFRIQGPVVGHLLDCALDDWAFATRQILDADAWAVRAEPAGTAIARGIAFDPGGPANLHLVILGALASATRSIRIVTPYFVPDASLIAALNVAALRGVEVDILMPARSDVKLVQWASTALLWQVLQGGARVWLTPPPHDHAKLMVVDGAWSLIGSANFDMRSLRLNFEFNVESFDPALGRILEGIVEERRRGARRIEPAEVNGRPLAVKLRDGVARLFAPYL